MTPYEVFPYICRQGALDTRMYTTYAGAERFDFSTWLLRNDFDYL